MLILDKDNSDFEFTDDYFLYLIDNHYDFDKEDFYEFIDRYEIDCVPQELRRWTRWVNSICQIEDRYFIIGWDQGLTEYQENIYDDSTITEVKPIETTKQIIITCWTDKEGHTICETINNG